MTSRQIYIVIGFVLLAGSFFAFKKLSGAKGEPVLTTKVEPPRSFQTLRAEPKNQIPFLHFTGPIKAKQHISLFAEVTGVMLPAEKMFREGVQFSKGEVIFALDDAEARLALLAAKAGFKNQLTQIMPDLQLDYPESFTKWKTYLDRLNIQKTLDEPPVADTEKLEYFLSSRNIWQQFYTIRSQEIRLSKFKIVAPFDGIVSQAVVLPGALVRGGNVVGEFIGLGNFEMEAAFDRRDIRFVKPGMDVTLRADMMSETVKGVVKRISGKVDERTQTVKVFMELSHPQLIDGLYLSGTIEASMVPESVEIPRSFIQHGDFVYTISDSMLTKRKIELIHVMGDKALVTGLKTNDQVVAQKITETAQGIRAKSVEIGVL